jgi:hypothetical protein
MVKISHTVSSQNKHGHLFCEGLLNNYRHHIMLYTVKQTKMVDCSTTCGCGSQYNAYKPQSAIESNEIICELEKLVIKLFSVHLWNIVLCTSGALNDPIILWTRYTLPLIIKNNHLVLIINMSVMSFHTVMAH